MPAKAEILAPMNCLPSITAPLDPSFQPAILFIQHYGKLVEKAAKTERLVMALEREGNLISSYETTILPLGTPHDDRTLTHVERLLKFLLWSRGGWKVYFGGPRDIGRRLAKIYSPAGPRAFDVALMEKVYERPFEFHIVSPDDVPAALERAEELGGHLDGCRIGFDLGASDHKIAAVRDGECVFSDEIPWNPRVEKNLDYHYECISKALKVAAGHLPRVDAIGGSSAGIYIDNRVMIASLFRSIPDETFDELVKPLFQRIQQDWQVPLEVINDGDVTALAGSMSLNENAMLGIAMGSSEAVGYLDASGKIKGWLNELAFAPVDYSPAAAVDEWSGDQGVGAMYFSQQAVNKLARAGGLAFPPEMDLPMRLKEAQRKAEEGHPGALQIFETIGVYLGYTIPYYASFYDMKHLLILGRVTSGRGGDIILQKARDVLYDEFPKLADRIAVHVPDEKSRRVGQAVAAASLPALR